MYEISELGIEVKQADSEVIELICLMGLANQTNQEKYELIKPFFERLNLYCDEFCLRLEKDTDLFAIPLSTIACVEYDSDSIICIQKELKNTIMFFLYNVDSMNFQINIE